VAFGSGGGDNDEDDAPGAPLEGPCHASIPGPGTCAGKGLAFGGDGSDEDGATSMSFFSQTDRSFFD